MSRNKKPRVERRYKDKVGIRSFKGRLSLRLPRSLFDGNQVVIALGLKDNADNRRKAGKLASEIERDIRLGCIDRSLGRYGLTLPNSILASSNDTPPSSLVQQLEFYIQTRKDFLAPSTWDTKYRRSLCRVTKSPFAELPANLNQEQSREFYDWLVSLFSRDTAKDTLRVVNKCFEWAIERGLVSYLESPLRGFSAKIAQTFTRVKTEINPFTPAERDLIIQAFLESPRLKHYCGYIKFCFFTGCRPSEAIGLKWDDIAPDFSSIRFHKTIVGGVEREGLKTQAQRIFPCNSQLKAILTTIHQNSKFENVFTNKKEAPLTNSSFIKDPWKRIISCLPIIYRRPYNMRHTFITLCLDAGMDVKDVARLVGNSPKIIYEHYAGVRPNIKVPIFDREFYDLT